MLGITEKAIHRFLLPFKFVTQHCSACKRRDLFVNSRARQHFSYASSGQPTHGLREHLGLAVLSFCLRNLFVPLLFSIQERGALPVSTLSISCKDGSSTGATATQPALLQPFEFCRQRGARCAAEPVCAVPRRV